MYVIFVLDRNGIFIYFFPQEKGAVLLEDSGNLYKVKSEMKYAMKSYCMEFYFKTDPDGNFFWRWGWVAMSTRLMFRLRKVFF